MRKKLAWINVKHLAHWDQGQSQLSSFR